MKRLKKIPQFKSEEREIEFWAAHKLTDYVDLYEAHQTVFLDLRKNAVYDDRILDR